MNPLHAAALKYAAHGWWVLPVWWPESRDVCGCGNPTCTDVGKHPITQRGQNDATIDPRQIDSWWMEYPKANIGLALAPSNLVGFDIDKPESYEAWNEIERKYGEPNTTVQVSGSGCHHVLFKRPNFAIKGSYEKRITLRGNNYIVVAPSLHRSGQHYAWQEGRAPWQVPPAELPPALGEAIRRPEQAQNAFDHDYPAAGPALLQEAFNALMRHGPEIKGSSPQGHTRVAWGILVNDFALSTAEAVPLIRAYNAMCTPPWPEERLFGSPCRLGQSWNGRRGERRDELGMRGAGSEVLGALGLAPQRRSQWIEEVALTPIPPMKLYSTTFPELDKLIGGFSTQQLTGIIAPPSTGKSALLGHWLIELAKHRPILHVSLELMRRELFVRYAAHRLMFPWKDGLYGKYPQQEMATAIKGLRIRLMGAEDFDPLDPWGGIEYEMKKMTEENGGVAPILAIDYIQLMARSSVTEMRQRVGQLTMRARQISQVFDTVVLGVFTTQRFSYSGKSGDQLKATDDPTAFLAAAKESGDIEFDCATLMFLDVDKLHPNATKPARIAVARCRVGDIGFVGIRARLDIGKFESDPSALVEMSAKAREERKQESELETDCRKLLETVAAMPNRGIGELRDAAKLNSTKWKNALAKLEQDGRLVKTEQRINGKPVPNGKTLEIRNADPPSRVSEEENPDADS